jgi:hypothetical protein
MGVWSLARTQKQITKEAKAFVPRVLNCDKKPASLRDNGNLSQHVQDLATLMW